ncbi:MAG: hypothetical protein IH598_15455 [Bacteroidales bacterium]|nr:hypothetical protein [Bacteroidales bacterium]
MENSGNLDDKKKDAKKNTELDEATLDTLIQKSLTNNKVLCRMLEQLQKKQLKSK